MPDETSTQTEQPRVLRDGYPAGVTCWVDVELPDPQAGAPFYADLFGWTLTEQMPEDAPGSYMEATIDGHRVAGLGSQPEGTDAPAAWNTYVAVESADRTCEQIAAVGGKVLMEPFDVMQAGRMAIAADPQGAVFRLWQAGEHRGAELVNEPGTWNFSGLATSGAVNTSSNGVSSVTATNPGVAVGGARQVIG